MKNRIKISNKVKPRLTVATKKVKKAVSMSSGKSKKRLHYHFYLFAVKCVAMGFCLGV